MVATPGDETLKAPQECSREKYWEELTDSQKIEKLGGICVTQQRRIDELMEAVCRLSIPHAHLDGKMVAEMDRPSRGIGPMVNQLHDERRYGGRDLLNRDPKNGPRLW